MQSWIGEFAVSKMPGKAGDVGSTSTISCDGGTCGLELERQDELISELISEPWVLVRDLVSTRKGRASELGQQVKVILTRLTT